MRIDFVETIELPPDRCYPYFRSPKDWTRLYGSFGEVEDRGGGWFAVPLRRFPFPLVARVTLDEPLQRVHWELGGIWRGRGEIAFTATERGTRVEGFEEVTIRGVPRVVDRVLSRAFLHRRFQAIWASGFRRLRREAAAAAATA